jgi:hypothetical protein
MFFFFFFYANPIEEALLNKLKICARIIGIRLKYRLDCIMIVVCDLDPYVIGRLRAL